MTTLRFIGALFLIAAIITFVADVTPRPSTSGRRPGLTSIAMHWNDVAPQSYAAARKTVQTRLHPLVWDPLIASVIGLPAWLSLGLVAGAFFWWGRPRHRVEIYIN